MQRMELSIHIILTTKKTSIVLMTLSNGLWTLNCKVGAIFQQWTRLMSHLKSIGMLQRGFSCWTDTLCLECGSERQLRLWLAFMRQFPRICSFLLIIALWFGRQWAMVCMHSSHGPLSVTIYSNVGVKSQESLIITCQSWGLRLVSLKLLIWFIWLQSERGWG